MTFCANFHAPPSWIPVIELSHQCKTQKDIDQFHAKLVTTGLLKNLHFTRKLILRFLNSPHRPVTDFANYLFFSHHAVKNPRNNADPFIWNSVIKSYSHRKRDPERALQVFVLMLENGVLADKYSFSLALKSCSIAGSVDAGMQLHGMLKKLEVGCDLFLENCLVSMYSKCGRLNFGRKMFDKMSERDSVSYNSMIDGYMKCGMVDVARVLFEDLPTEMRNLITWNTMLCGYVKVEGGLKLAWELFEKMPERDVVSWNTMMDCCAKSGKMEMARALFDGMPERDVASWAIMIDGYTRVGCVDVARGFFDKMPSRDVISCNSMMAGYVRNKAPSEALKIYHDMTGSSDHLPPDYATLLITLSAIALLGNLKEGLDLHEYIKDSGFVVAGKLGVALIDMYAKCGSIECAIKVFDGINVRSIDHWNSMIGGLAIHGLGELAFDLFLEMEKLSIEPGDITFIAMLNACGHSGLVKEGMICFEIMRRVHDMSPKMQHYGCIIDILSRAGRIEEARRFVEEMPVEPNSVILRTLLGACSHHENLSIGEPIARDLISSDSCNDSSSYVLLSNMYAQHGFWDNVRSVRNTMKEKDLKKFPGCSSIELEGLVHEFYVGDTSHLQVEEIYNTLC